jgi:hypothetical protein
MPEDVKQAQIAEMWGDYEARRDTPISFYQKRYPHNRLPSDLYRFLRNDPEADYYEVFVLID